MAAPSSTTGIQAKLATLAAVSSGILFGQKLRVVEAAIGVVKDLQVLSQVYDACVDSLQTGEFLIASSRHAPSFIKT